MMSFRGDVHKIYLKVRQAKDNNQSIEDLQVLREIDQIDKFYRKLNENELNKIRYRMMKEQGGNGMIPVIVTSIPWLAFIFSKQLQSLLFENGKYLWLGFVLLYGSFIIGGMILHQREKAWANVHIEMIENILTNRREKERRKLQINSKRT